MATTESKGVLKTWKDDRGFGFIKPDDGSEDIFIHISALKNSARRPYRGETICYQIEHTDDGKSKAVNARIEGVEGSSQQQQESKGNNVLWVTIVVLLVVIVSGVIYVGIN